MSFNIQFLRQKKLKNLTHTLERMAAREVSRTYEGAHEHPGPIYAAQLRLAHHYERLAQLRAADTRLAVQRSVTGAILQQLDFYRPDSEWGRHLEQQLLGSRQAEIVLACDAARYHLAAAGVTPQLPPVPSADHEAWIVSAQATLNNLPVRVADLPVPSAGNGLDAAPAQPCLPLLHTPDTLYDLSFGVVVRHIRLPDYVFLPYDLPPLNL